MFKKITRGYGLLENFLAKRRAVTADKLIPNNLRGGRILDIGCGFTPYFLINTVFEEKYGIDLEVGDYPKNINIQTLNIENNTHLNFDDKFFDVITMLAVFEHIKQDKLINLLKEIKRCLKSNGIFILTVPCPWTDVLIRLMVRLGLVSNEEIKDHKGKYDRDLIKFYLNKAGFEIKKINFGYFEFFLNNWVYVKK